MYTWHSDLSIDDNQFIDNLGGQVLYLMDFNGSLTSNTIINPETGYGVFIGYNNGGRFSLLVNNIIAHHNQANIAIAGGSGFTSTVNGYHNTLDDAPYGLYLLNYSNVILANSIVSHHTTRGIYKAGTNNTIHVAFILFDDHLSDGDLDENLNPGYGDPLFVNAASNDYHIQAGSPARDHAPDFGYYLDFEGDPRPMGTGGFPFDIGADEFWWKLFLPEIISP